MVSELSRCLTLCAPSGWSFEDRREWLAIAVEELAEVPAEVFRVGCQVARRTIDHPAKIIPAIMAYCEPAERELRDVLGRKPVLALVPQIEHQRDVPPQVTQAMVNDMPEAMIAIGLGCGALVRNADGRVVPAA